jgi:primosomal protein N''
MERICSPTKGRPITLNLPAIETVADVLAAQTIVINAMAAGELTADEAATVSEVLECKRRSIETVDMERRLAALESRKR